MAGVNRSARFFEERIVPCPRCTRRTPGPRHDFAINMVHTLPLELPSPTTEVLREECGMPPDAGLTKPWPHGEKEVL